MILRSLQRLTSPSRQAASLKNLYRWSNSIQEWLYPPTCLLCSDRGQTGLDLCQPCHDTLPWLGVACHQCGLPLTGQEGQICGECLLSPPPFDHMISTFRFEEPARQLILSLKFHQRYANARLLGTLLARKVLLEGTPLPDIIIPMPLHHSRYRERGFNQALEIARSVSSLTGIPVAAQLCQRVRATESQSQLHADARRKNIRNAFAIQNDGIPCRHVAILDDVVTTAATVSELARMLRQTGVERIDVWSCSRALK